MKKEILDEMIKVASALDAIGLYKEASNVDRIARVGLSAIASVNPVGFTSNNFKQNPQVAPRSNSYSVTGQYSDHIGRYKALVSNNDIQGATNYYNAVMRSSFTPQQKGAFKAQADRIRNEYSHDEYKNTKGETILSQNHLTGVLLKYGLQNLNNKKEFDKRWTNMMTALMYEKDGDGNMWKDSPSWHTQMNTTYRMLTQRFPR